MGVLDGKELEETINVLEKPLEKRSKNELTVLINLTKDIPFFKEYRDKGQKEIHEQCVAHMQYQFVQDKQYVFEIGTTGDKFYLILNGKCGIYIKIGDPPTLTCVKVIEGGAGFGEVALLKNQPRLASILCQTDCHLATLDKQSFIKILKQAEEDKLTKEMEFFAKMPMFVKWASHSLKLLYLNTYRVKCKKGEYLFKEGQSSNAAYIVCQGEFTATKKFTQEIDDAEECLQKQKHETLKFKNLQKDNSPTKDQRIVFWQPYELFGEEEFIDEIQDLEQEEKQRRERIKSEQAQAEQIQIEKQKKLQKQLEQKKKEQELKKQQNGGNNNNNKNNEQNKAKNGQNISIQVNEKTKIQKRNLSQSKIQFQNNKNDEDEDDSESEEESQEQVQKKQIQKNKQYLRKYSVQCTSVVGEVCMIKKYDFIHRVLRDTMSRQIIQERNKIKNGWFYNKVDGVNKLMSYSDYCTFYYTDLKLRNRIQGALAEEDEELQEFVNVVKEAFQQNDTLVRFQRKRNTKSEDVPHYSSKEIKKYDIPIHAFGNKSQNMQRMNTLEQDALEEKAKKGIRKPPDIMDELVKKFHQNLKQNYYARFKKDSYEQFSNMVQHIEHQGLKSMIKQDDRVNPILKREKSLSEGLKKQSSALIQIAAAKKFCKVLLKIRDRNQIQKKIDSLVDQKPDIENQDKNPQNKDDQKQKDNFNVNLNIIQNEQQFYNFNTTTKNVNSSINQTQIYDSPKRGESENQETKITDSPKTPETLQLQRRKFFSVDSYQNKNEQQQEETLQEKRRFRNLAKINTQIEQISKLNNQVIDNFQLKACEDRGESPLKNPQYFITKNVPNKPRSKSREPYKFELEKLKIFQITQPDINKSLSSLQLDNKNSSLSTIDKSQIIHSSSSMPNKIASQRQKLKLIKKINYIGSQNEQDNNSIQSLINKFGGENILNQKQLNQQQQQAKQISQLRSAKSYQSINNNIIFQSKQNYAFASQNGQIQVNSKQFNSSNNNNNNNNGQKNASTNTDINLTNETQRFNSVHQGQDSSQSPLKIQQIINSILTQKNQQKEK
ncbi:hypothetical protein ABPG74_017190 [Tetrahymena malaccensis]